MRELVLLVDALGRFAESLQFANDCVPEGP
jgi:hypothetical protein